MRLLGGVCPAADHGVWVRDPAGRPVDATAPEVDLPPGTPVAVGPRAAGADAAGPALAELAALVAAAGGVAAGGGVDLGGGFRSARTDGGAGDRRDGVLAALTVAAARDRLGDRTAVLVGLFGPEATRPLGAAAQAAVEEGRWAALRFAAAASDLLGPEQLVSLLASRAPDGVDPFPHGLPSVVAGHLAQVLREVPRPRRLDLLADLWEQVCAAGTVRLRSRRLRASQSRKDRINDLWARRRRYEDDELTTHVRHALGPNPAVADTALWRPRPAYWVRRADRALHDAWAGTVLARLTVTAVDEGLEEALARHRHEIEAAADRMTAPEAALSTRAVTGLTGLPARPGPLLMFLRDRTRPGEPLNRGQATSVWQRLAHARDYAELATYSVADFINLFIREDSVSVRDAVAGWLAGPMAAWRERVGYFSADRLDGWNHHSLLVGEPGPSLGERLRAQPDRPAAELETVGDMFWYVELVDAQARLRGLAAADVQPDIPDVHVPVADPDPPEEDPLVPRRDSIPLAAAGAAQLAGLGGQVPRRCRTWSDLVTGLLTGAAVAESLTGSFPVPAGLAAADGTELPGTDASVEVARTHRQLVEWSSSMANCIAGPRYAELAATGRAALIALRAPDGRILANAELRPAAGRWRVVELQARFNQDPGEELRHRVRAWAAGLPGPAAPDTAAAPPARRARSGRHRPAHPSPAARLARDLGGRVADLVAAAAAEPASAHATTVIAALAAREGTAGDPYGALTALRRATGDRPLAAACRRALADPAGLVALWQATGDRPLARVLAGLPDADADRLGPLLLDAPLPRTLRALARLPGIAPVRTGHLVALRVRAALGTLLRDDASELARAVDADPYAPLVRAAALAVTSWGGLNAGAVTAVVPPRRVEIQDFPRSALNDQRWEASWPDATELGAVADGFWDHIADHGLLLPASWLSGGGWPALWSRAARHRPPGTLSG